MKDHAKKDAMSFSHTKEKPILPRLGLMILQADEMVESDFRRLIPNQAAEIFVSRLPCDPVITPAMLRETETVLTEAAARLPENVTIQVGGFACTSGVAHIGSTKAARLMREGAPFEHVTDPIVALIAACKVLGVRRIAMLSPFSDEINERIVDALERHDVQISRTGSFGNLVASDVARIDVASVKNAARALVTETRIDALFLCGTNMNTLEVIESLESEINIPILSSNQVLAWHMARLGRLDIGTGGIGKLWSVA